MWVDVGNVSGRENSMFKGPEIGIERSVNLQHFEKGGMNKGPYHAGLAGQVDILSFILRAVGANARAPNLTGKMPTYSAN